MISNAMLLLLSLTARAQESAPPAPEPPPAEPPAAELPPAVAPERAALALDALQAANARALLEAARTLLGPSAATADRVSSASALAQSGDPAALTLLEVAVDARDPEIQIAALGAFVSVPGEGAVRVADAALRSPTYAQAVREAAVTVLGAVRTQAGADALWSASSDRALPDEIRRLARAELERSYPALLVERGQPEDVGSTLGVLIGSAGNGLTGAVMLSAIGTWGQNDGAAVIGGIGGGIIGVGTGALYGATRKTTLGQGLAYTTGSTWGFIGSLYASKALFNGNGEEWELYYYSEEYEAAGLYEVANQRRQSRSAGARLVGTLGGAAAGFAWMGRDPSPSDVLEVDLSAYLGLQLGLGVADLTGGGIENCAYEVDGRGQIVTETIDCTAYASSIRARNYAGLGGLALGLGAGALSAPGWSPEAGELAYGAVGAAELGWVGGWLPTALGSDEPDGNIRLGLHGGAVAGLALAHALEPSPGRAAMAGWGAVLGNALGAGLPMLGGAGDEQVMAATMIPMGLAGTAAGTLLAPKMPMSGGDLAMLGVGAPLSVAQGAAMANVLADVGALKDERAAGLTLTFPALTGLGLTALTVSAEPEAEDMFFLGSAAAWGVWYGLLTPVALNADLDDTGLTLSSLITGDVFLLAGGLALPASTLNLNPRRTVIPQLAGVTGATLGALGAALASPDGADVARGAVLGSTVGLIGGGVVTAMRPARERARSGLLLPELDPPGDWSATLAPGVLEDGATGVVATLRVTGL